MEVGKLNETDLGRGNSLEVLEGVRRRMVFVTSRRRTLVIPVVGQFERAVIGQVGTQAINKINKNSLICKVYAYEVSLKLAGPSRYKTLVKRGQQERKKGQNSSGLSNSIQKEETTKK